MKAEEVKLVEESEGFELHVLDVDGERHVFNVHGCLDDLGVVGKLVDDYYAEGRKLAREYERELALRDEWHEQPYPLGDLPDHGLGEIDGGGE